MSGIISKFRNLANIIKENGGFRKSYRMLYRTDDLKAGKLVGSDKYGNRYFENPRYMYPKDRWVIYNEDTHLEYDGSQIPPEWHGWMHHTTDYPPTIKPPVKYHWMIDHEENKSGTKEAFYPWSTARTKVHSWEPGSREKQN